MCSFVNGTWYCFQVRIQNAWMRGVVFRMPRSLVPGRGHGKRLHRCSLCNCAGHRLETCPSAAGELIRSLREQLRQKGKTSKKKQQARRNFVFQKKGTWRKEAAQRYFGRDTASKRLEASRET